MAIEGLQRGCVFRIISVMPHYRIYFVKPDGHLDGPPKVIQCEDDNEAKEVARQFIDGRDIELWDGDRVVAKIPRH